MRRLYERVLADREARGASHDVSVEDILAVVERRGPEAHRAAVLNRLLATAEGRRELDLVRAAVRASQAPRSRRLAIPLAIAATLVLAIIGREAIRDDPSIDRLRGDATAGPIPLLSPPETLPEPDSARFVWGRLAAASSYDLELLDDAGNILWTKTLQDTSAALPDSVRLERGRLYQWRVVASTESGTVASALRELRVPTR